MSLGSFPLPIELHIRKKKKKLDVIYFALTFWLVNFVLHEEHLRLTLTLFTLALLKEQIRHPPKEKKSRALFRDGRPLNINEGDWEFLLEVGVGYLLYLL